MVYVVDISNKPLMPTMRFGKVRRLLKEKKAKVLKKCPFTIKLLYETTDIVQDINLGVDTGSKVIGLSATTKDKVMYEGEVKLRNDIARLLASRSEARRARRNRKTRYRKPRFNNRVSSKKKGWLAPSIKQRIETHLKVVDDIHKILPINKVIVEVAQFDVQKIKNPNIKGEEYQEGEQLGFWNVREYILFRDRHTCQNCKGKSKDKILNVHHIEGRKTGGDAPNNLITLCKTCHNDYHKGKIKLKVKRGVSFRDSAFMGIMRWAFYNKLKEIYPNVSLTYGYITKSTRIENNLEKAHHIDARCVSQNPLAKEGKYVYFSQKVRCHNRQIHKFNTLKGGNRRLNQSPYKVKGFRLFDKVEYQNERYFIFGRRKTGFFDIRNLQGEKVNKGSISYKKLKFVESRKNIIVERRASGQRNINSSND